ncbi:bifunctional phosphoribosyl-AMP cyclohydrolase/phosphoribosyl-ATP diphosphatase HisIE [Hungatella sp. L12]|uniref:Histidine biosynthesis bifunctional protein HisIE n=1 Tax=Hungatella hominis TaxID=2763050 RepID=A0ABR7H707_9FIRM|nr:bifunctional phosphoribosyl-AMP cyclohydrolase/phosphoribosyl-ATP diphosphatase HisIE [Hungatella hominis]MBC5708962.1 bifunctional phosphoribosyl-AMP cyclohydrolase/phosphoribosyl-ATP diphosphatase HisIE [Hungatella hominis]
MKEYKKVIPGFGIREGKGVLLWGTDCCEDNVLALSRYYGDSGADELFLYDMSETDEDHERSIGLIKEIARTADVPVITGGRVRRLEDVKKYLYAGAKAVFLNVDVDENVDMMKEASDRFGDDKIYAWLPDFSYLDRTEEYSQLGASVMILGSVCHSQEEIAQMEEKEERFILSSDQPDSVTLAGLMASGRVSGVIGSMTGKSPSCMELKQQLKKNGVAVDTFESAVAWEDFKLNSDGLIPVIVQDYRTSEVLMLAYMNQEAFETTLHSGLMVYFSRSRQSLWLKGETSGHYQYVKSLSLDCDNDTLLAKVNQIGAACHTGARSCFFQTLVKKEYQETNPLKVFEDVFAIILDRKENPKEGSYTNYLFDKGIDKILKKLGEEATEIVIAAKNPDPEEVKYEISDFLYHMMVLMADKGVTWEDITRELANR